MSVLLIKRACPADLPVIHDMAEIVFRHTYASILSPEQMEYMMEWMYSLPNLEKQVAEGHVYHIAYADDVPCGYVSVQSDGTDEDGVEVYHLQKIYVLPSCQGKGIGQRLLCQGVLIRKNSKNRTEREQEQPFFRVL